MQHNFTNEKIKEIHLRLPQVTFSTTTTNNFKADDIKFESLRHFWCSKSDEETL